MRRLISILFLLISPLAFAVDYEFLAGSTDRFIIVNMYALDGTPKTGLVYTDMTITYTRNNGSADVDITEATMTMGTHTDGGWIQVDATNSPGLYQFAMPDAAIATGAQSVIFSFKATDTFQRVVQCSIINVDLRGSSYVPANVIQIEGSDATNQINAEADTALADYDAPTNAEMVARTVTSATYATATALSTAQSDITSILADTAAMDTSAELQTLLFGGSTAGTTVSTNVAAIIIDTAAMDTSGELQTLIFGSATPGATAASLTTAQSDITAILADTSAADTASELQTLVFGSATPGATATALSTAQGNITSILADTDELQTRFGLMIEADGGDWRFDANSLEQAPTGGGGDATAANQTTIISHLTDIKGATWASTDSLENIRNEGVTAQSDLDILTGSDGATLATSQPNYAPYTGTPPTVGAIRAELEGEGTKLTLALADTDELQTKLSNMIEADGADWRYTINALEQGPAGGGGGGGDATEANQLTIIDHLTDIKGATWESSTDSLEAIANTLAVISVGAGSGNTLVNEDTGGTDELQVVDGNSNGIQDVSILAYVASEFAANPRTAVVRATATTSADGRWKSPYMMLESGTTYTLYFFKAGVYGPATTNITP